MSNLAKYQSFDMEAAAEEQKALDEAGGDFIKTQDGKNSYRFLPTPIEWGLKSPFVKVYQHFLDAPGGKKIVFNCPRIMDKRPCAACAKSDKLRATGNPRDRDEAYKYQAKLRVFANVIDRANPDKGPGILGFGKTILQELVRIRSDADDGGDYTNPGEDGFDIIIHRKGQDLQTEYTVKPSRSNSALGNMDWLEMQKNPMTYARVPTDDEIAEMLGLDREPVDATPARGSSSGGGGRANRKRTTVDTTATEVDED